MKRAPGGLRPPARAEPAHGYRIDAQVVHPVRGTDFLPGL